MCVCVRMRVCVWVTKTYSFTQLHDKGGVNKIPEVNSHLIIERWRWEIFVEKFPLPDTDNAQYFVCLNIVDY